MTSQHDIVKKKIDSLNQFSNDTDTRLNKMSAFKSDLELQLEDNKNILIKRLGEVVNQQEKEKATLELKVKDCIQRMESVQLCFESFEEKKTEDKIEELETKMKDHIQKVVNDSLKFKFNEMELSLSK